MFANVAEIVTNWYGRPTNKELLPPLVDDAIYGWNTGSFEGQNDVSCPRSWWTNFLWYRSERPDADPVAPPRESDESSQATEPNEATEAGIRIDLTRIGGQQTRIRHRQLCAS
ncbi:hypothetical protein JNB88_27570 [Rhizobium cauense]|uniref:hypothetical protein n=1 Tax=Rhizobium cauense TaxID=1166683 RepID=UPI001C6DFA7E|nr:hypothetical protein [Rhizobium cauense]